MLQATVTLRSLSSKGVKQVKQSRRRDLSRLSNFFIFLLQRMLSVSSLFHTSEADAEAGASRV